MLQNYNVNIRKISNKGLHSICILFVLVIFSGGCNKFVQIDPPTTAITAATVYTNNSSASSAITGVYINMMALPGLSSGNVSIGFFEALAADELKNYSSDATTSQFYANSLTSSSGSSSNYYYWTEIYNEIHVANAVIEGLTNSSGVTPSMKEQLTGEAKFIRAFLLFYAVNLYGDVPLATSTDYILNNSIKRSSKDTVYQQIIRDLKDAQADLPFSFVDGSGNTTSERTRPNSGAATAMLARTYLYTGKWDSAETQASVLIANASTYSLIGLDSVFFANSQEAVWQLEPVTPGQDTWDAQWYILTSPPGPGANGGNYNGSLSTFLWNAFEPNDKRQINWVGVFTADSINYYYYPFKYKVVVNGDPNIPVSEYTMVLRLAEQYLIRAEARAQQGNIMGAQADLNVIRNRAGLPNTTANDQTSLLNAILHERQVELFTEWGHRWFDLIRTGNINSVMGSPGNVCQTKGGTWNSNWELLPLPLSELQINPNLTQNPGY